LLADSYILFHLASLRQRFSLDRREVGSHRSQMATHNNFKFLKSLSGTYYAIFAIVYKDIFLFLSKFLHLMNLATE